MHSVLSFLSLSLFTPATGLLYWLDGLTGPLGALGILVSAVSAVLVMIARRFSRASD